MTTVTTVTTATTATEFSARPPRTWCRRPTCADVDLEMPPAPTWFTGRDAVVGFLGRRVLRRADVWRLEPTRANGQPALTVHRYEGEDRTDGVQVLTVVGGRIGRITSFNDPTLVPLFAPVGLRESRGR